MKKICLSFVAVLMTAFLMVACGGSVDKTEGVVADPLALDKEEMVQMETPILLNNFEAAVDKLAEIVEKGGDSQENALTLLGKISSLSSYAVVVSDREKDLKRSEVTRFNEIAKKLQDLGNKIQLLVQPDDAAAAEE